MSEKQTGNSAARDVAPLSLIDESGHACGCCGHVGILGSVSRRTFLGGLGTAAVVGMVGAQATDAAAEPFPAAEAGTPLPLGKPLKVQPVFMVHIDKRQDRTSWRSYGGIDTPAAAQKEAKRIGVDLKQMVHDAEFPVEMLPLIQVNNREQAETLAQTSADVILLFAASGGTDWINAMVSSDTPLVMFIRHQTEPFYLWYEIAHWRFLLRQNVDTRQTPRVDAGDIVVDNLAQVLWRLRAMYGLKNAKGTTMLAIGGLMAYSEPAQENGPICAEKVWDYQIKNISEKDFASRLAKARADDGLVQRAERLTKALLAEPNVTLKTKRKFVFNSYLALEVCQQLMQETGATNFGFARCMGRPVIEMLDTPPCLILSLANDAGYTAYCHTDLSHTFPGVLMRWVAGRPTFLCNSHFPHDGLFTVAHCAAPRKMNGKDNEPATLMTHYESDYGAALKVDYTKDQTVTVVVPNLRCTKWQAFRGKILESPSYPACRSQMEIAVEGDWRRLQVEMEGFHTQIVYGDYLQEIGYAAKKVDGLDWQCFSEIG